MTEQHSLIPMSPGEALSLGRSQKGWSKEQAAEKLKCSVELVAVMESDEQDSHLAPVYQRGFLKRYVDLLGLPADVLDPALQEKILAPPELRTVFPNASSAARASDRWLRASSYVLASLLVGTLAWQISHEAIRLSRTDADGKHAQVAVDETDGPRVVATEAPSHVNASIASLETLRPSGGRTGDAGRSAWAALESTAADLQAGEHILELAASADSWVEILGRDNALIEQDLVRGGSYRQYRGFAPFRITLGRSTAIQLSVDGTPLDLGPHTVDGVTQMVLAPETATPTGELSMADSE